MPSISRAVSDVFLLGALSPSGLLGQLTTSSISGTLTDPSGAVISDAVVTAVEMSTGAVARSVANNAGFYVLTGLAPEVSGMIQASVESSYARFLDLVGRSRGKSPAQVDEIAQGRPWAGGAARRLGLVDEFGGLDDALAYAAKAAKLGDGDWHAEYLGEREDRLTALVRDLRRERDGASEGGRDWAGLAA